MSLIFIYKKFTNTKRIYLGSNNENIYLDI